MKIIYLILIASMISFSEEEPKKQRVVEIRGFEETYYWNPNSESLQSQPVSETMANNNVVRYEYTNFDGNTITRNVNGKLSNIESVKSIDNINLTNDPSKSFYSLYFSLNRAFKMKIELFTEDGKKVADLFDRNFKSGSNQTIISKEYPQGVYLIHFIIDGIVKKQRVLFKN